MIAGSLSVAVFAAVPSAFAESATAAQAEVLPRPAWLGRSEAELREAFGTSLLSERIAPPRATFLTRVTPDAALETTSKDVPAPSHSSASSTDAFEAKDLYAEQKRYVRHTDGANFRRVDYELFRSQIYRVRWQLGERFERPAMSSLVAHLGAELGKPDYDQLIAAPFGSGRATLRRAAWSSEDRIFELRQLNPMVGGPIFVTLSDPVRIQEIVASGGAAAPEPDSLGRWWTEPISTPNILTPGGRDALIVAFDAVREQFDWRR